MNISLLHKHALVGGSTQGIGHAVAMVMAEQGANITLLARNEEVLQKVVKELDTTQGQEHGYIVGDFSQPKAVEKAVQGLVQNKPVHILLNNTGGPPGGPLTDATTDQFLNALNMHLLCNHLVTQVVLPGMKAAGYGRIIQIISTSVKEPIPGLGVSNTTRGAVASWAKTLASEVAADGITVNNLLPGFMETQRLFSLLEKWAGERGVTEEKLAESMKETVPAKRFGDPREIANVAAFLASPAAAYVTGTSIPVDGGRTKTF